MILLGYLRYKNNSLNPPLANLSLPDYTFIYQPSNTLAGGVGSYIKKSIKFTIREDLSSVSQESESLWIEINNNNTKNIICGVIYRHPSTNLELFFDQFYPVLDILIKNNKIHEFLVILVLFSLKLSNENYSFPTFENR